LAIIAYALARSTNKTDPVLWGIAPCVRGHRYHRRRDRVPVSAGRRVRRDLLRRRAPEEP
jgi:hypothetical protein